jgi:hypothetical protein
MKLLCMIAVLVLSTAALAQPPAHSKHPDGEGDPDTITCRTPQTLPGQRLLGPEVCKLNSQWALLRKNGQDISADGSQIIADPKGNSVTPMTCSPAGGGTSNGGGGMMVCR